METNAYHSTAECNVQQHICNENFFNQNFLRTFRGHQNMNRKKFFRKFPAAVGFSCLLFVVLYAYAKNPDCKKFRDGKFKIVDGEATIYIVREGKRQAEIMEGEEDSSFFVVKWIDDCTYTLVPTKETWKKKYSF